MDMDHGPSMVRIPDTVTIAIVTKIASLPSIFDIVLQKTLAVINDAVANANNTLGRSSLIQQKTICIIFFAGGKLKTCVEEFSMNSNKINFKK